MRENKLSYLYLYESKKNGKGQLGAYVRFFPTLKSVLLPISILTK